MLVQNSQTTGKEGWMSTLAAQSWQAELLFSGALVAGLFQLPKLFSVWVSPYVVDSSELGATFISYASLFVFGSITSVIVFLLLHLILRGIWIALLGLNSVYPAGINVESKAGSGPRYWKKMKSKYPSLSAYNEELDDKCSLILSVAVATFLLSFSLSVVIVVFFLSLKFLISLFPGLEAYVVHISAGIYFALLLLGLMNSTLAKKENLSPRLANFLDKYAILSGLIFSLYIFRKPFNYIVNILTSNNSNKLIYFVSIVFGFSLGVFGGIHVDKNPCLSYLNGNRYFTFNNKPYKKLPYNYLNLKNDAFPIFTPVLNSDVITGQSMELFIPIIGREKADMNITEFSIIDAFKTKKKERRKVYEQELTKHVAFNEVYINGNKIEGLKFFYNTHSNAGEEGIVTYIPMYHCTSGHNVLEIRKNYFSKDGVQKIVAIPFQFEQAQ